MLIAVLISGRVNSYENFLHLLERTTNHTIHLYISVNDDEEEYKEFYEKFKIKFRKYIKKLHIEKYNLPNNFVNCNADVRINGPTFYRTLSCFYNDTMAMKFAKESSIDYDIYLRFRTDIIVDSFPSFETYDKDKLYCVDPLCKFTLAITDNPDGEFKNKRRYCYGNTAYNGVYVTGDIAYGNKELMDKYCNCYEHILEQNAKNNGNYFICFEYCLTTYLYDICINWQMFKYNYMYCENRFNK
jgi:hypothetical protein